MQTAELAEKLVAWTGEQLAVTGARGLVLGLSGGIDSAVLAVLCQRACPQFTLAVIMPCASSPEDREHALLVAGKFGIATREVALDGVYQEMLRALPDAPPESPAGIRARANLKARLRMVTLYFLANQRGCLVAGSSNRSELATGYFTKYGDGAADILPLGNLVKGQVRELASYLSVPRPIIEKPPSAGLWEGQTDEAELGFSYRELDRYLLTGEAQEAVKTRIESLMATSRHKRSLPPVAVFPPE